MQGRQIVCQCDQDRGRIAPMIDQAMEEEIVLRAPVDQAAVAADHLAVRHTRAAVSHASNISPLRKGNPRVSRSRHRKKVSCV